MNIRQRTALIIGVAISALLLGCTDETAQENTSVQQDPTPSASQAQKLLSIRANYAPPEKKQTPTQSALHQLVWELSNSEKRSPTPQDIQWTTTFLQNSVVMLKVPVTDPWFNLVFLSQQEQEWTMFGYANLPVTTDRMNSSKNGLNLPMNSFNSAHLSDSTNTHFIWAFLDEAKHVVIWKYPHTAPFSVNANAKVVSINGREGWYATQETDSGYLYYIEQGHVVWLTGNVTESELLSVARSLPSSTSHSFPYTY
ncbi:hypothetical protein CIG75_15960 [Tumebacillus algifaecis]|uniref:DUF4367 domain-containing protein n=1 Tax=Tumebacillus algifaecis TaxID=1214604 RepID=A0A223D3V5_9BACL|nr:hypothetical protein [Tumebacillus algifaecis]ASS76292.1 hypothetical protein CIG75_15960 [Tumebacillus algifaecis]